MDLRPRRATSQIGKSRRNGEAAMRVLRNWASQGAGSRLLFVCTEIYPRVPPIWVSALPWMEELSMELVLYGARQKRAKWSELENGERRGSSSWESGGTAAEASASAVAPIAAAEPAAERRHQQRRRQRPRVSTSSSTSNSAAASG